MKVGTIGTSFIAEFLVNAINKVDGCKVIAAYSRNEETGKKFAEKLDIARVYTDLNELYHDDEVECIYVASPNSLHFQQAKGALMCGKHVMVEKPFVSNVKECKELIALAKEKKLMIFEAVTTIHNPNFKEMKKSIKQIGQIKIVQCNMSQYSRKYDLFKEGLTPNVFTTKFSGGALMDINIYNIHFVVGLFGRPTKVWYNANIKEGIDTSGILTLVYDGFVVSTVGSKDNIGQNFVQIQGENGYIYSSAAAGSLTHYDLVLRNEKSRAEVNIKDHEDNYYSEMSAMATIIHNKDYDACYELMDHSVMVMEVVEEARKCAGIVFEADSK